MVFIKFSVSVLLFFSFSFSDSWVLKYKDRVFYESDFYSFFPQSEWKKITDYDKRSSLFYDFKKVVASVYEAQTIGLDLNPEFEQKLDERFTRLLVNEYYMRSFLMSVVPKEALSFCKKNLKKEVHVKHVLVEDSVLASSLVDSLSMGESFSSLAKNHSVDPSVNQNLGTLGWITVGQTIPAFQNHIFETCLGCVGVVSTDFGFHVIVVDSLRSSKYKDMKKEEYNDFAFKFATGYIEEPLKDLASSHDSLLLNQNGVHFNNLVIAGFIDSIKVATLSSKNKSRSSVDFVGILNSYPGVFFEYNKDFYGGAWIGQKFLSPFYKSAFFDDAESFIAELRLLLLRDIVKGLALEKKINETYSFVGQFNNIKNELLQKEFLRFLVNSVEVPNKDEIEKYYFDNEDDKFTNKSSGKPFGLKNAYSSVESILLKEKQDAVKNAFYLSLDGDVSETNERWLNDF